MVKKQIKKFWNIKELNVTEKAVVEQIEYIYIHRSVSREEFIRSLKFLTWKYDRVE